MGQTHRRFLLAVCGLLALAPRPSFAGSTPSPAAPACIELAPSPPETPVTSALRLYEVPQYVEAVERFRRVVDDRTSSDKDRQRAAFYLGKSLFKLRLFVGSLAVFTEIAASGPSHEYYYKSMEWLASLTQVLPPAMGVEAALARYPLPAFDRPMLGPMRDTVFVAVARHRLRERNVPAALEALAARKKEPYERVAQQPALDQVADELERSARALQEHPDAGPPAAIAPDPAEQARIKELLRTERQQVDLLPTYCNGRVVPWLRTLLDANQRSAR